MRKKSTAPGEAHYFRDDVPSETLFPTLPYDVDLHIRFLGELLDLSECVPAGVVFPIRNNDQGFFPVFRFLDFFQAQVKGIKKSSFPTR